MFQLFSFGLILFLLVGCGGGSGGGSRPMSGMPPDRGGTGLTAAQVIDQIGDIGLAADRLHSTDLVATPGSRLLPNLRADASCGGTSCDFVTSAGSLEVTTGGLSDLSGSTVTVGSELHGIRNGQVSGRSTVDTVMADYRVYGGWLDTNFFGVVRGNWSGTLSGQSLNGLETLYAFSTGNESGSNPMTGSATWTGLMVGLHKDRPTEPITGQTQATYSFTDQTMDVSMTGLTRGHADISWENLRVSEGRFSAGSDNNSIAGSFYGSSHGELGGVFERNSIMGAFGATR